MVFYYTATGGYMLYMGKDKFENEELIAHSWPEDLWFHVDRLSSAHVYLRMSKGEDWRQLPPHAIEECAQLVKANSIQGNKINDVDVVYTPASNLKKTADMEVGQVGFKSSKEVLKIRVPKRINEIINRLERTMEEKHPDLAAEKRKRDDAEAREKKQAVKEHRRKELEQQAAYQAEKEARSYDRLFEGAAMRSNADAQDLEDDFM